MHLTGLIGRVANAILVGVVAFLVVFVIGAIAGHYDASVGSKLEAFSALIGLLVGILYFFARPTPSV